MMGQGNEGVVERMASSGIPELQMGKSLFSRPNEGVVERMMSLFSETKLLPWLGFPQKRCTSPPTHPNFCLRAIFAAIPTALESSKKLGIIRLHAIRVYTCTNDL
jgi:hypothetical protein